MNEVGENITKKVTDYAMKNSKNMLIVSIIIDLIGMATYLIPAFGEFADAVWGPYVTLLIKNIYGNTFFAVFGGAEETLPFSDFIPTATLAWLYYKFITKTI